MVPIWLLLITGLGGGKDVEVFHETGENNSIRIMARNNTSVEQSVELKVGYKGMEASGELPAVKVVSPGEVVQFVILTPTENAYGYNYEFTYIKGDVTAVHDDDFVYRLPYKKGQAYKVDQGYNEQPTHMDQYALDFNMDEGTEVCAVRDGVVVEVVDQNSKGCGRRECSKYNNYILIKHADGSVADYSHIQKKGSLVKAGDRVEAGQAVARSGATGWASGPHLHFEVYVMRFSGQETVAARFHLDQNTTGIPQSGEKYEQVY